MHRTIHHKAAVAAALLIATGLVSAQSDATPPPSTPGKMNSTTSPNPLQVRPADGTPNSATGSQTPGTGTGSSRTMRNPTPTDSTMGGSPSTTTTTTPMPAEMSNEPVVTPAPMVRPARRDRG